MPGVDVGSLRKGLEALRQEINRLAETSAARGDDGEVAKALELIADELADLNPAYVVTRLDVLRDKSGAMIGARAVSEKVHALRDSILA